MFERFTDRARKVLVLAQEEARLFDHSFVGTEHILLGLIHEDEGVAAKALQTLGLTLTAVREKVDEMIGMASSAPSGSPPYTPGAKKVFELSLREAQQLGHSYIGTEHLLLGLVRQSECVAAQVLVSLGVDLGRVRQQVIGLMTGDKGEEAGSKESRRTPVHVGIKEMKYRPMIGPGDFDIKTRQVGKFLTDGYKVKITVMFRASEVCDQELGKRVLDRIAEQIGAMATVEVEPRLDGANMVMVLAPDKRAEQAAAGRARNQGAADADDSGVSPPKPAEPDIFVVGRRWSGEVVVAGRRSEDFAAAYDQLGELAGRLGLDDFDASRIHLSSVETGHGPGLRLSVVHELPSLGNADGQEDRPEPPTSDVQPPLRLEEDDG